jgi:Ca-activated chloride channel homolog
MTTSVAKVRYYCARLMMCPSVALRIWAGVLFLVFGLNGVARAQQAPSPTPTPPAGLEKQAPAPGTEEVGAGDVVVVSANLVSVPVIVMNRQGQYVTDLQRNDFRVYEDGKEQAVVHFSNVDQPFSVVLLIDTSGSTAPFIEQIKSAAKAFVEQLRPADTIRPVYFHGEIKPLTAEGINDRKLFDAAIDRIAPGPWTMGTRLYDAVDFGLGALRQVSSRKAVILLTDGENTWGKATMKSTLRDAEESDVVVYTVQYGDLVPQTYLQQLAEKTGGRYFRGGDVNSIRQSFTTVAAELRRQYVLGYRLNESARGGVRTIKVKVDRKRVSVRARRFYTYGQ